MTARSGTHRMADEGRQRTSSLPPQVDADVPGEEEQAQSPRVHDESEGPPMRVDGHAERGIDVRARHMPVPNDPDSHARAPMRKFLCMTVRGESHSTSTRSRAPSACVAFSVHSQSAYSSS